MPLFYSWIYLLLLGIFCCLQIINQHTLTATTNGFRKVHRYTFSEIFYFTRFADKLLQDIIDNKHGETK